MPKQADLLTLNAVAAMSKTSYQTVLNAVKSRRLPSTEIDTGGKRPLRLVKRADVEKWMAEPKRSYQRVNPKTVEKWGDWFGLDRKTATKLREAKVAGQPVPFEFKPVALKDRGYSDN